MIKPIQADTVSAAWYKAVTATRAAAGHKTFHLIVSIEDPLAEDARTRHEIDMLLANRGLQTVDTVANTIMPAGLAAVCRTHEELVTKYRNSYDVIRRFRKNSWGTYFGRLVAYPIGSDKHPAPVDQLAPVIKTLRQKRVIGAEYETAVATVKDAAGPSESIDPGTLIHHPTRGRHGRGGPCLSSVAFQREDNRVHAVAHYRSHYLVERAYGNYLGLGQLVHYVAHQAGLEVGHLTVLAGYAQVDGQLSDLDETLGRIADHHAA
ncbi:hypothetical protein [Amycolatopsis taiwanensis]|uniref:hypothetical protein n=1 Tax=Amycolatopsis taiwanensis TaxID=342230 RepID=UPI0004B4902B|nr:hypothetical protein [Amycolatopsis taiwanensis]